MEITFNGELLTLPHIDMTVSAFIEWKNIKGSGIAIALNNKIVPRSSWNEKIIKPNDILVLISAAYGG